MNRVEQLREEVKPLKEEFDRLLGDMMAAQNYSANFPSDDAKRKELEISEAYNRVNNRLSPLLDDLRRAEVAQSELEKHIAQVRITSENDSRTFWFRRFHTSLAIANGGAFAAVASKIFDKDANSYLAYSAWYPILQFTIGVLIAGLIPVALYVNRERLAWLLSIFSAVMFALGILSVLVAVWVKAEMVWPWQL